MKIHIYGQFLAINRPNKIIHFSVFNQEHENFTESFSSMDKSSSTVYKRALWIGHDMIWPRCVLLNAGKWNYKQKCEYDAAWAVQRQAILKGLANQTNESVRIKEEKVGQCAPDYTKMVFDAYFPIAELSGKIQYEKGVVMGLENGRDRNEAMLETSKLRIEQMQENLTKMQEDFVKSYPHHLERNNRHFFIGPMQNDEETVGQKRPLEQIEPVQAESADFWTEEMLWVGSEMITCAHDV
jgi:hypothetical protein